MTRCEGTLENVKAGKHTVEMKHADGNITKVITVELGDVVDIDEQIFAGWVVVLSPKVPDMVKQRLLDQCLAD